MTNCFDNEQLLSEDSEIPENISDGDLDNISDDVFSEESIIKRQIPSDRYNFAYIVFYLLGISTLIPWNFFITADDYWMYKFREVSPNDSESLQIHHTEDIKNKTDLQVSFTSYISISSGISNTVFLTINVFISKKISFSKRLIGSQCIILVIFFITSSFVKVNTDQYQTLFLIITLVSVIIVNAAGAVFGASLLGMVGLFSSKYITAMSAGQALGGIVTALTEILSLWIGVTSITSGLVYFIIGDIILLVTLIAYLILEKQMFFKYHTSLKIRNLNNIGTVNDVIPLTGEQVSYFQIFKKIQYYGVSIFLLFFITMAVYPSVTILIDSVGKGYGHSWNDLYFVPVVTYLIFSCGDYFGRILSGMFNWPKNEPLLVMIFSILRVLFIPAFLYCNIQPRHHLPVYIHSDVYYILLTIFFALSNGYLCNTVFVSAPLIVNSKEKEVASAMLCCFLGIGLSAGSVVSLLLIKSV